MADITLIQLSNYVKPDNTPSYYNSKNYVTNGKNNSFFRYVIDRYYGSPTNESIINVYHQLLYGRGISIKGEDEVYSDLLDIFPKKEIRATLNDFKLQGMFTAKLVRSKGGGIGAIKHFPVDKCAMEKADKNGNINAIYYSFDWRYKTKYPPQRIPVFQGRMTDREMILLYKPYQPDSFYFSYPDYLAGLQYAQIEEEISNFSINHIKNGLSFGYIINVNNSSGLTDEKKNLLEQKIKDKLTGSTNAGRFVLSFNDGTEADITVVPLEVNDAHNQWESLRDSARDQLITVHGVTSPLLFGIQTGTGFSSNADELNTASKLLQDYQIDPKQEEFLDAFKPAFEIAGLETDLEFLELRETYTEDPTVEEEVIVDENVEDLEDTNIELSKQYDSEAVDLKALFAKGETIDYNEWDLIDDRKCELLTLKENDLNVLFQFASIPSGDARKTSEQDTSLFKVRYKYAGNPIPQRDFCRKVMTANKVYRAEDLENAGVVNPGFGVNGANTYNIFLYKGGVNCRHWWQRVIYLRKNNERISVNDARKMILELEPEERDDARWEQNPTEVAQTAGPENNYWRVN